MSYNEFVTASVKMNSASLTMENCKPTAVKQGASEQVVHPARMNMKLPLQRKNFTVNMLSVAYKDIVVQYDKAKSQCVVSSIDACDEVSSCPLCLASTAHSK